MNKWLGSGRLTRDPNVRVMGDGSKIATFSIAVDRRFGRRTESGTWERETDFFDVLARGGVADYVDGQIHKGSKVIVEGSVENNNFTSREGTKNYSVRIVARSVERMEEQTAPQAENGASQSPPVNNSPATAPQPAQDPAPKPAQAPEPAPQPASEPQAAPKPVQAPQPATASAPQSDAPDGFTFISEGIEEDLPF